MPVNVSIVKNGNHRYIRVCQSYRNEKGQPTSRVIENHGRLDLALAKDPQYVEKLRERVKEQNELEKQANKDLVCCLGVRAAPGCIRSLRSREPRPCKLQTRKSEKHPDRSTSPANRAIGLYRRVLNCQTRGIQVITFAR